MAHKEYAPAGLHEAGKSYNSLPILSTSDLDLRSLQMKGEETGNPLQKGFDLPGGVKDGGQTYTLTKG